MVLSRDVYDSYGNMILSQGTRLTQENIAMLGRMGGGDIFFQDHRVDDVPVSPLIPARLEGEAAGRLRTLLEETRAMVDGQTSTRTININPLQKTAFSLVEQFFPMVLGEVNAVGCFSLKDYNFVHPVQVAGLSLLMGRKTGYSEDTLTKLAMAALLENIGYAALPLGMMEEPAALTSIENHEVHQHPQYGYQILRDYTHPALEIIQTVFQHHERWNGSGYPRGLKGKGISLDARILAIADTYYALVSRRPHRQSHLPHEAIEFMMAYSGELFDPELISLFTKLVPLYPTSVMVKLNTGESGIIVNARPGLIGRPVVRICYNKNFSEVTNPFDMDLSDSEHQHRLVTEIVEY